MREEKKEERSQKRTLGIRRIADRGTREKEWSSRVGDSYFVFKGTPMDMDWGSYELKNQWRDIINY